jgi:hypothetical protein
MYKLALHQHIQSEDLVLLPLEIDFEGTSYRLVYRVYNSSSPRYINIISFGEHDLAYERAIARK